MTHFNLQGKETTQILSIKQIKNQKNSNSQGSYKRDKALKKKTVLEGTHTNIHHPRRGHLYT